MPTISREQTRALERGAKAPQVTPPTPLGSMMFQAFAKTSDEIGVQQANLYQQEANQVLNAGLDYDEQTKRLSSLRGKYTFGLLMNPGAIMPTPSEKDYNQKMADQTKRLQEDNVLSEMIKRIEHAQDFQEWEGMRDNLASTLGDVYTFDFRTKMNAVTERARIDFNSDYSTMEQTLFDFSNRNNNDFLNKNLDPTVEDYDELVRSYEDKITHYKDKNAFISTQLATVLQRAGSTDVVEDVARKYSKYLTVQQVDVAMDQAQKRAMIQDTGDPMTTRVTIEARSRHILGLPLGVDPRFIASDTERSNEAFLAENRLGTMAPEAIRENFTNPISGAVEAKLRQDLQNDPFSAMQNRGLGASPSTLTLPNADGNNLDKYEKGLADRLEQVYQYRNDQYKINDNQGTSAIRHAHTQAEIQVLDATYQAASPETKARMALAEYRAYQNKNIEVLKEGHKIDPGEALPFKDPDVAKFLDIGLTDSEFLRAFPTWIRMKQENPTKAAEVIMALVDSMNGSDPSANNVYDDYTGLAMYAATQSGISLLDLSVGLTGIRRNVLDPFGQIVLKNDKWLSFNTKGNPSALARYNTKYSNIVIKNDSPIAKNISNMKKIRLSVPTRDNRTMQKTYSLLDLLESNGQMEADGTYRPLARLRPENGSSTTRFYIEVTSSIESRNAGIWRPLTQKNGSFVYVNG